MAINNKMNKCSGLYSLLLMIVQWLYLGFNTPIGMEKSIVIIINVTFMTKI